MVFRLNQNARHILHAFARESLVCANEQAVEDIAFARLQATIDRIFEEIAPESEMAVLRKHQAVQMEDHLNLTLVSGDGGEVVCAKLCFCPRDPTRGRGLRHRRCRHPREGRVEREVPSWFQGWGPNGGLSTSHLSPDLGQEVLAAYRAYEAAVRAHDDARDAVLRAVNHLIESKRTLEALIEVWPSAEQARERIGAKSPPPPPSESEAARIASGAAFVARPATPESCDVMSTCPPDPA